MADSTVTETTTSEGAIKSSVVAVGFNRDTMARWLLICALALVGCSNRENIPRDLYSGSIVVPTPSPTTALGPIIAPMITDDGPTATIVPTDVSTPVPMPIPTETPAPEQPTVQPTLPSPQQFTGSGKQVQQVTVQVLSRITLAHDGERNFAVTAFGDGDKQDLLVNAVGVYQGTRSLDPGTYTLEIDADGQWIVDITAIGMDMSAAGAIAGSGDDIRGAFVPATGRATYQFRHDGDENFAVLVRCGDARDLVINEIGIFQGSAVVTFGDAPICLWEITADGNWTITPVP
jgi:hypothetical protein